MRVKNLLVMFMLALLAMPTTNAQQAVNVKDSLALIDFYDSTDGPNWQYGLAWRQGPVATWYGVEVIDGRVTSIDLPFGEINGPIPESFGDLTKLKNLQLGYNRIVSLPESFGNLINLQKLDLVESKITTLPNSFGNLSSLQELDMSDNVVLESLPPSFGKLANLKKLELSGNRLTSFPDFMGQLTNLEVLNLAVNSISSVSETIGNLQNLVDFSINVNKLKSLPESFGNLTKLVSVRLNSNSLTSLPESFGNLTNLQIITLTNNQLRSLPSSFLNALRSFDEKSLLGINRNFLGFTEPELILKEIPATVEFIYHPQFQFQLRHVDNKLIAPVGGTPANNTYYWYRDDMLVATINGDSTYTPTQSGTYRAEVTNSVATKLRLVSETIAYATGPVVNIKDVTIYESDGKAKVMVHIDKPVDVPLRLSFKTVAGTATAHGPMKDYTSRVGYVKIRAGDTTGKIRIPVRKDDQMEGDETFYVVIRKKGFREDISVVGRDTALVTIRDGNRYPEMSSATNSIGNAVQKTAKELSTERSLRLTATPNPANGPIRIYLVSTTRQPIDLRVVNASGVQVEARTGLRSGQTVEIGQRFKAGTYFVTARSGKETETITVVRQ